MILSGCVAGGIGVSERMEGNRRILCFYLFFDLTISVGRGKIGRIGNLLMPIYYMMGRQYDASKDHKLRKGCLKGDSPSLLYVRFAQAIVALCVCAQ